MKRAILSLALVIGLLSAVVMGSGSAGSGVAVQSVQAASAPNAPAHFFDKTRFLAHMGIAYYAFHHWVIIPWQHHQFNSGAPHRTSTIVKAGIATLFAYHEAHVAYDIANKSNSKLLHALVSPINKLLSLAGSVGNKLKKGQYSTSDLSNLSSSVSSVGTAAAKNGYTIKDIVTPIKGL
ncbi:MAG TPA: hypothetical protein VKX16_01630 [Chloroflexota bacterium]|nr:hypothetical protein [Chloroflexota bacterium]